MFLFCPLLVPILTSTTGTVGLLFCFVVCVVLVCFLFVFVLFFFFFFLRCRSRQHGALPGRSYSRMTRYSRLVSLWSRLHTRPSEQICAYTQEITCVTRYLARP